jgi:hypothetical protein
MFAASMTDKQYEARKEIIDLRGINTLIEIYSPWVDGPMGYQPTGARWSARGWYWIEGSGRSMCELRELHDDPIAGRELVICYSPCLRRLVSAFVEQWELSQ